MKPRTEQIFVKIMRNGFIPQLGICGPIPNPIRITRAKAHSLIVAGIDVYQYFPENHYTEKLTLQTVFGKAEKEEIPKKPVEKKVSEPMKPVELTGIKKEEEVASEVEVNTEEEVEDTVDDEMEIDENEVNDVEDEVEEPEETSATPNNQQNNNNYNKKKKRNRR